jgi:hypothetical protein
MVTSTLPGKLWGLHGLELQVPSDDGLASPTSSRGGNLSESLVASPLSHAYPEAEADFITKGTAHGDGVGEWSMESSVDTVFAQKQQSCLELEQASPCTSQGDVFCRILSHPKALGMEVMDAPSLTGHGRSRGSRGFSEPSSSQRRASGRKPPTRIRLVRVPAVITRSNSNTGCQTGYSPPP